MSTTRAEGVGMSAAIREQPARSATPKWLMGAFVDDYNGAYRIDESTWRHGERMVYHIVAWHPDSQFLIARNADTNPSDGGRWTRIDWMPLDRMAPYTWAYCLSAWKATSRGEAEAATIADRRQPRSGCNGFPFSRMRPAATTPDSADGRGTRPGYVIIRRDISTHSSCRAVCRRSPDRPLRRVAACAVAGRAERGPTGGCRTPRRAARACCRR